MAAKKREAEVVAPKSEGGIPLLRFAFWPGMEIFDLKTSSFHIGSTMENGTIITSIELVGDLVIAELSNGFDDTEPTQWVVTASSGAARVARGSEIADAIKQAKRDRGMQV